MRLHPGIDQGLASQRDDPDRPDSLEIYISETSDDDDLDETPERQLVLRHFWGDADVRLRIRLTLSDDPEENPFLPYLPDELRDEMFAQSANFVLDVPISEIISFAKTVVHHLPARAIRRVES